jgi:nickel transport protein
VRRRLAQQQQRPVTVQDVIGGVGYILGLLGVALYLKSRKGP